MQSVGSDTRAHVSWWTRRRLRLGMGLLLAVVLPALVAVNLQPELLRLSLFRASLAGAFAGVVLSDYFFGSLSVFPGTRTDYYILPVYLTAFAAVSATFLLARLEYSRPLLLTAFVVSVSWQYVVRFKVQRGQRFAYAVVPFGRVESLYDLEDARWQPLSEPVLPPSIRAVVADFNSDLPPIWEEFLADAALRGVPVMHFKELRQSITGQVEIEHLSENANGTLVPNPSLLFAKLILDFVGAMLVLVGTLPLLALIALAIRLDSPGSPLFRQRRIGYRGRPFNVWKFRTMYARPVQAEDDLLARESAKTGDRDPRVTRLGRFLRKSRLDELPQLFNILRLEMSWIGPRPEAEALSDWYRQEIPFYRYRHIVRPGISGWAQVSQGHVSELEDISHKLQYDFYYISNFSVWLDVLIVVRTIKTMLTGFGAR